MEPLLHTLMAQVCGETLPGVPLPPELAGHFVLVFELYVPNLPRDSVAFCQRGLRLLQLAVTAICCAARSPSGLPADTVLGRVLDLGRIWSFTGWSVRGGHSPCGRYPLAIASWHAISFNCCSTASTTSRVPVPKHETDVYARLGISPPTEPLFRSSTPAGPFYVGGPYVSVRRAQSDQRFGRTTGDTDMATSVRYTPAGFYAGTYDEYRRHCAQLEPALDVRETPDSQQTTVTEYDDELSSLSEHACDTIPARSIVEPPEPESLHEDELARSRGSAQLGVRHKPDRQRFRSEPYPADSISNRLCRTRQATRRDPNFVY